MMERPDVPTPDIDEDFLEEVARLHAGGDSGVDVSVDVRRVAKDYRAKIEAELWAAWDIAQGLVFNQDRDRLDEEKRLHAEEVKRFNAHVHAHRAQHKEEAPAEEM